MCVCVCVCQRKFLMTNTTANIYNTHATYIPLCVHIILFVVCDPTRYAFTIRLSDTCSRVHNTTSPRHYKSKYERKGQG